MAFDCGGVGVGGGGGVGGGDRGISWNYPLPTESLIFVFIEKAFPEFPWSQDVSQLVSSSIAAEMKRRSGRTYGRTDLQTDLLIKMQGRI